MLYDQEFSASLERSIALANQLEQDLLEETAALDGHDPEQLRALVEHKRQVVEKLEEHTARLKRIVEKAGHEFTTSGLESYLSALAPDPNASGAPTERWRLLRGIASRCALINQDNAKSIERHRKRVATALNLIRGEDGSAPTYSAHGNPQSTTVLGRTLVRA